MTMEHKKQILNEGVKTFSNQQWFRDLVVYDSHPHTGEPTLEFKVNYIPLFEKKAAMDFGMKVNLAIRFTVVDRNGKPVE
jgi:hypothetical protein